MINFNESDTTQEERTEEYDYMNEEPLEEVKEYNEEDEIDYCD
jgi:hypothetical protein